MTDRPRTPCPKCGEPKTAQGMPGHLRSHKSSRGRPKGSNNGAGPSIHETRLLNNYLRVLNSGEKVASPAKVIGQIAILNERIQAAQEGGLLLKALKLTEARNHLEEIAETASLEENFKKHAKDYSARFGISYETWNELNVPPKVLKAAGISR